MHRRGFTLLELLAVMAVVATLLAIAIPRYNALRDTIAVRGATGELAAAFSAARSEAITRRARVALAIDTAGGRIDVRTDGSPVLTRTLGAAYGVMLTANRDSIVFDQRGMGYGLSNLTVTVRRGGVVDTLTMSRLGRVRW